jgi:FkbM family methyltransferase
MHATFAVAAGSSPILEAEPTTQRRSRNPLILRVAPLRLRIPLYFKIYRNRRDRWQQLYRNAPLHFAPGMRMNLCATDEGHADIAFTGFYEHELSQRVADHRTEGGLMIDVGANYGYFSLLWAAGSAENRVLAFEASPRNGAALEQNISRNAMGSQIEVRRVGAGKEAGTLAFALGPEEQTGWGGFSSAGDNQVVEVPVVTLDSVIPGGEAITLLKIDVEGADTWVLYGARQLLLEKRVQHIYFEQNKTRMAALGIRENEAADFLRECGYMVEPLGNPDGGLVEYYAKPANG